jgi:hypothetical protein
MIDFEDEIEVRLREFQYLTGKGNVKDAHKTLYEILRLMLGMMASPSIPPGALGAPHIDPDPVETIETPEVVVTEPTVSGEHRAISSAELSAPKVPLKHAPHGLTKFGNPRRIRNNTKRRP